MKNNNLKTMKNSIRFSSKKFELTKNEKIHIKRWLELKESKLYILPTIIPISDRIHLDFIGWNNEDFMDVLICENKNRNKSINLIIKE